MSPFSHEMPFQNFKVSLPCLGRNGFSDRFPLHCNTLSNRALPRKFSMCSIILRSFAPVRSVQQALVWSFSCFSVTSVVEGVGRG